MAGIAGIYCADGHPAELAELQRMTAAVEERGPDGVIYWNSGPVAFAHLQFCTTPESIDERQPLGSPAGEACLVWNGRLDNREELLDLLAACRANVWDRTDPGLVMAAYLQWGTACLPRLVGDFALALWDARQRRLWCARDYVGIRPFYYYWDGKTFLFAPEIRALLAHRLVSLKINEGVVAEFLENSIASRDETLYHDIRCLPSGSTLTIDSGGEIRIASWWNPNLSLLHYRSDEEYAEHFRHLMDQSVLSRMRCNTEWGVEMSGGLDSSTISVAAQALLDRGGRCEERVRTFSLAWPGKPWDESEDIAAVVQKASLRSELVRPLRPGLEFFCQRAALWRDYPGNLNGEPMTVPIFEAARRSGARVLMNGIGGDEWLQGSSLYLLDLAAKGRLLELLRQARGDWQIYGRYRHWSLDLARQLVAGAVPRSLHAARRKRRLMRNSILSREFLRRTNLADRIFSRAKSEQPRFASRAQERIFSFALAGLEAHVFEWNDREAAHAGIEPRYPFFDRRLAEFCLRIPHEQLTRGGVTKFTLRNAMRDRLPERVRMKATKAEFSELFEAVLYDPSASARLKNLAMMRRTDWLDPARFSAHMSLPVHPCEEGSALYNPAWKVLAIDLWLESILVSGGKMESGPFPIQQRELISTQISR